MDSLLYNMEILALSWIRMIKRRINIDSENEKGVEVLCCGLAALVVVRWSHAERRADFIHFGCARRRLTAN